MSIKLRCTDTRGNVTEGEGEVGQSLLEVGQALGMPLEGTCEGQMACSTCHVVVDADWFDKLPEASDDSAVNHHHHGPLACRIIGTHSCILALRI